VEGRRMKVTVSREYQKRPAQIEIVDEEIEIWECPKCHGTIFTEGTVWQIEKKTEDIYDDFRRKNIFNSVVVITCAQCHAVVWISRPVR
jgi:predicted nucleic-acid-binding Zn-ribbon protein